MDPADIIYRHMGHSAPNVADSYGTGGPIGVAHSVPYCFSYSFEEGLSLYFDGTEIMARTI